MADDRPKGSIIYKILIVILTAALVGTILYPKHLWEQEKRNTLQCRANMVSIMYAEYTFHDTTDSFTASLDTLSSVLLNDTTKKLLRRYARTDTALAEQIVRALSKTDTLAKAIADTVREYARLHDLDNPAGLVLDSLMYYPKYLPFIDSAATYRIEHFKLCPTVNRPYIITVVDTSVIKTFNIECPITKEDSLKVAQDFWKSKVGGLKITNHGRITKGEEMSWKK